jgi:CHAT domain-containing protein/Tfp pilus assembly protein PilF
MTRGFLLLLLLMGAAPADPIARGQAAWDRGDMAGALVQWSVALDKARKSGDRAAQIDAMLRVAAVDRMLGRLDAAAELLDLASGIAESDAEFARVLTATGLLEVAAGDPRRAERTLLRAVDLAKAAAEPGAAANAAVDLGLARLALGRTADAGKAFSAAVGLFSALDNVVGQADALVNHGVVLRRQGALAQARTRFERAVTLYRSAGNLLGESDALTNLGLVLQDLGDDEGARTLWQQALATAETSKDVRRQATLHLDLGTLAHASGDRAGADAHYQAAELGFTETGATGDAIRVALDRAVLSGETRDTKRVLERARRSGDPRLEAIAAVNLALALRDEDVRAGHRHADRALQLAYQLDNAELSWRALYAAAALDDADGQTASAISGYEEAAAVLERTRMGLGADADRGYASRHRAVYQALLDALLREGDASKAFLFMQRLQLTELPPAVSDDDPEAQQFLELVTESTWLEDALGEELASAGESERAKALRNRLAALRVEFATTVDQLRASYPQFDQLVRVDPEDLEAVQEQLDPGVLVVQPILFDDRLVLLTFRKDGVEAHTVEVAGPDIERAMRRITRILQAGVDNADLINRLSDELGAWLLEPIAEPLRRAEIVVFCLEGPFRAVPFGMLRTGGKFLTEQAAVVSVTHVGSLRQHGGASARFRVGGASTLLLGNPDGSLPGAEQEVTAIATALPGSTLLVGAEATREALYESARGKTVVHLATHGVVDPDRPDRSYLVLGTEDHLAYAEIPGLAPYLDEARLVVLSACESGLPVDVDEPGENGEVVVSINGLAAQFRRAGVETLVASLWKVDDDSTLELMTHFYAELAKGRDVARALQAAQLAMLDQGPLHWGAFVIVGDWR